MGPAAETQSGPTSGGLSALLAPYPRLRPPVATARAAVTIVLRDGAEDVEVLLIERASNPADPASGHVALPGGRVEERDGSLADTAVRELEEEVGIPPTDVLDSLRFVRTVEARRFGLHVGVFAAELASASRGPSARSAVEVAHVFWLPRRRLDDVRPTTRLTSVGEIEVPATVHEGHVLWGFTRRVLCDFFGVRTDDDVGGPVFAHPSSPP